MRAPLPHVTRSLRRCCAFLITSTSVNRPSQAELRAATSVKAMILAAGRGERMRPLTDRVPKPLITAAGRPLIVHLIERLARSGFTDLVVNVSHLADLVEQGLGDGSRYGVRIDRKSTRLN